MDAIKQIKNQLKKAKRHELRIKNEIDKACADQHLSDTFLCYLWDVCNQWTGVIRGLSMALRILEGKDGFE